MSGFHTVSEYLAEVKNDGSNKSKEGYKVEWWCLTPSDPWTDEDSLRRYEIYRVQARFACDVLGDRARFWKWAIRKASASSPNKFGAERSYGGSFSSLRNHLEYETFDSKEEAQKLASDHLRTGLLKAIEMVRENSRVLEIDPPVLPHQDTSMDANVEAWIVMSFAASPLRYAALAGSAIQRGCMSDAKVLKNQAIHGLSMDSSS